MNILVGNKVRFPSGEYKNMEGIVESFVPQRYREKISTLRVRINEFPKPGGWNGLVIVREDEVEKI